MKSLFEKIKKLFLPDETKNRRKIANNCVNLIFNSYINEAKPNSIEVALITEEVCFKVMQRLNEDKQEKQKELLKIETALDNLNKLLKNAETS